MSKRLRHFALLCPKRHEDSQYEGVIRRADVCDAWLYREESTPPLKGAIRTQRTAVSNGSRNFLTFNLISRLKPRLGPSIHCLYPTHNYWLLRLRSQIQARSAGATTQYDWRMDTVQTRSEKAFGLEGIQYWYVAHGETSPSTADAHSIHCGDL